MTLYGYIAIIMIFVCLLIIGGLYIWLFALAHDEEHRIKKYDDAYRKIISMLDTICFYSTGSELENEIFELKDYVKDNKIKTNIVAEKIVEILQSDEYELNEKRAAINVSKEVEILKFYRDMLQKGDVYEKSFACRKLALFNDEESKDGIRKCVKSKNKDLSYNAAMALAAFGEQESIVDFILHCEKNFKYSHRVILEIMDIYTGELSDLAKDILNQCDDYIKSVIIKGLAERDYPEFENMYAEGLESKNPSIKIACARALAKTGKPEYEFNVIVAAHDQNWIVRSNIVKEFGRYGTESAMKALVEATADKEWWVRFSAAKTLVDIDENLEYVGEVLNGYDRYASDAVKFALHKKYQFKDGQV